MPPWLYWLWVHRPVISTADRILRRLDETETAAYQRGLRAGRAEAAVEQLAERIEAGPSLGRHQRLTSTGTVLGLAG